MKAREFANSKLVIFDIDDTLVNTNTRVDVRRDGRVVRSLNSHEFTTYQLEPGEEFDFGRFRDAREFQAQARPIPGMIGQLRRDIETGNRVIMLTARADFDDRDVFLDTFRAWGIDMDQVHVYRAGNIVSRAPTEEKKAQILRRLMGQQHYDKVIMYDDSVPNLQAFLALAREYPWSRFYAWHVDPTGEAREYHRSSIREDDDHGDLPSVERARQAIPQILARAQQDYDAWDETDRDTYAGGGICHIIADSVCDVLSDAGIECTPVSCSHEQHVYVAARFAEGIYTIDIPYHVYEQGGGFSWKKLPDVRFEPRDVVFYRVSGDPADWRDYIDEGMRDVVNFMRNIGSERDAPIVMMTNPQNTGARTASGQRMRIEDFPLRTVAVSELRPWEPMIKMRDLPSQRTVASLIKTLQQGGRIPPLLVTPVRGGYRIIDGHHRYAALQRAGIEQVPVRVVDPRLIRYSDEVREALKITLERYGHLAVKEQANPKGEIKLGPQLFVSRQTTTEDIKPRGVAWTSTAQKTPEGFTSDWVEWCKDNMAQWVTDTGILYDVAPGARILLVRTDRDVIRVARRYGLEIENSFDLFEKMDWNVLRQDYDAVHHIPQGRNPFMSAWDVESTAWFDRKFLTNPRRVTVDTGKTHDIGETGKPGVAEGQLDEIYKMPPTKNSSQGMTVWAYNDAIEKKSPVVYRGNDVIIFAANENLLRYIRLQDGKPVLYIGFTRFLDGYKSGTVATEMSGRGKGLAKQAYLDASDILKAPIYSDSTQTDASRLGIWDKLIQQYPDRVVGFDQKNNQNLPLSMTDRGPVVNQNQPIYVDRNKKDSAKPVAPNQRYRTRILKLLPVRQGVAEGIDPNTFEELDARIIARAAKQIVPTARARRTPDGYVHVTTPDGLDLYIGAGVADGVISVNIGSGGGVTTSGAHKGAVTDIIRGVYNAAVRKYGEPDTPGELTIDHDAGHGVWQHIADKLGLRYAAVEVKESDVRRGQLGETRDQLWSWIQAKFPSPQWPEYVQRDFLYAQAKGIRDQQELKDFLERNQKDFGQIKWRLEKLPITLDIFTPKTQRMIKEREGGASNPYQVPKDSERHALQQRMIQQKGVSPEPIIVAKLSNGYDLIEGWHRTIQHLKAYPQGYTGPAWVGYGATYTSESKQGVAEGRISDLDQDLQDQQWEAVVGRVEHGVRRGENPDGMSLALYQWATGEMFDMDEELERRGFGSVADLADHIRDHGGRYVPPEFDLSAGGSLNDLERRPRRRPDDVSENFADGRKPGRKGLSKRVGIPRKATLGQLEKIAKSSTGERRRMAQWQLNMRRGQKKNK